MTPEARKADDAQKAAEALQEEEARKAAEALAGIAAETREALDAITRQSLLSMQEAATRAMDAIAEWRDWIRTTAYPQLMDTLQAQADAMPTLAAIPPEELQTLTPGILQALADYCKGRGIDDAGLSISDLAQLTDPDTGRQAIDLAIEQARKEAAREARKARKKELAEAITPDKEIFAEIMKMPYLPAAANAMSNALGLFSKQEALDPWNPGKLVFEYKGKKLDASKVKNIGNSLPVSVLKLWDMATGTLLKNNKYRAEDPQLWVNIPLTYYADIRGRSVTPKTADDPEAQAIEDKRAKERLKDFRKSIKKDIETLADLRIDIAQTGKGSGNFIPITYILNDSKLWNDIIMIHFAEDTAATILAGHLMQYPIRLQAIQGNNPNPYRLGRAMYDHASSDSNIRKNVANTLTVKTLLDDCPDIETLDQLKNRKTDKGRKNSDESRKWKTLIKGKLEQSLKVLEEGGVLLHWTYRDAKTARAYSAEGAEAMDYNTWQNLRIDYELIPADSTEALAQDKRRKRNADKATAAKKKKDEKAEITRIARQAAQDAAQAALDAMKRAEAEGEGEKGGGR